jgi:hypothetical protein
VTRGRHVLVHKIELTSSVRFKLMDKVTELISQFDELGYHLYFCIETYSSFVGFL